MNARQHAHLPVLGIDVGGVLVDHVAEGDDTSFFGSRPLDTPAVSGAFAAVAELCTGPFEYRVHIVSKAGPKIAGLTREWLGQTGFYTDTGVSPANVWFVRRREEKAEVCRKLAITHFVDDRLDVLMHLGTVAHRYLFTGGLGTNSAPVHVPRDIPVHQSWPRLASAIRATVEEK